MTPIVLLVTAALGCLLEVEALTVTSSGFHANYVFADGDRQIRGANWNKWMLTDDYLLPDETQVVGLECSSMYYSGSAPIGSLCIATFKDDLVDVGVYTDVWWKCSSDFQDGWADVDFDDSAWEYAYARLVNYHSSSPIASLDPLAKWIGANMIDAPGHGVYCRYRRGVPPPRIMSVSHTCDLGATIYVDGVENTVKPYDHQVRVADHVAIPDDASVFAVECHTQQNQGFLLAGGLFDSDIPWKCHTDEVAGWQQPGFDTTPWPNAKRRFRNGAGFLVAGIPTTAYFIWQTNLLSFSAYCVGQIPPNPCGTQCANGGTCVATFDGSYKCLCTNAYTGIHCETSTVIFPCAEGESLRCLTCKHAWSDEFCELVGYYEECTDPNPICTRRETIWHHIVKRRVFRGCGSLDNCAIEAYGPEGRDCYPYRDGKTRCESCEYGPASVPALSRRLYQCGPVGYGTFFCKGDPHCHTFDGLEYQFQGTCWSVMTRDACSGNQPAGEHSFIISANINTVVIAGPERSFVRELSIELPRIPMTIYLLHGSHVLVNQVPITFFPWYDANSNVGITRDGDHIVRVTLPQGIIVAWSGKKEMSIRAADHLQGTLCGLGGDFNGDPDNDNLMGPASSCFGGNSQLGIPAPDFTTLTDSWFHMVDLSEQACIDHCTP